MGLKELVKKLAFWRLDHFDPKKAAVFFQVIIKITTRKGEITWQVIVPKN